MDGSVRTIHDSPTPSTQPTQVLTLLGRWPSELHLGLTQILILLIMPGYPSTPPALEFLLKCHPVWLISFEELPSCISELLGEAVWSIFTPWSISSAVF